MVDPETVENLTHYGYIKHLVQLNEDQTKTTKYSYIAIIIFGFLFGILGLVAWTTAVLFSVLALLANRSWDAGCVTPIAKEIIRYKHFHPIILQCAQIDVKNGNEAMREEIATEFLDEIRLNLLIT